MKIALVYDMIYPYSIGGAEVRNYSLAKRLTEQGHEVHLYGIKLWKGPDTIKKDGVFIHGICRYTQKYNFKGNRSIFEPIKFSFYVFKSLIKEKFDIIDCSAFPYFPAFSCKLYSVLRNTPLVITWHEVWRDYWYEYLGWKGMFGVIIEKIVSKLTKNIISVSNKTKNNLLALNVNKKYVSVVYNWVDIKEIEEIKKFKEEFDVFYAGRLMKHKNIDILIKSVYLAKKEFPDIKTVIIGNGPEKTKLKALTRKLNLEKNIKFMDFMLKEQVYRFMKSSKLFVLPSVLEGFGIIVIEANACGIPVITVKHKRNASADLIKNYNNGFVCNLSESSIAEKILILLKNSKLRENMSKKSIRNAENYDIKKAVIKLENIYKQCSGN
jgi:glycosyltransferase involved in cell wall biosynthesis